jgi:hypothetical protein
VRGASGEGRISLKLVAVRREATAAAAALEIGSSRAHTPAVVRVVSEMRAGVACASCLSGGYAAADGRGVRGGGVKDHGVCRRCGYCCASH